GTFRVLVEGLNRGEIIRFIDQEEEFVVEVQDLEEEYGDAIEEEALMRNILKLFEQYVKVSRKITKETLTTVSDIEEPGRLADIITSHLSLKLKEKQDLLEMLNTQERLHHLIQLISNEKKVLDLEKKIGQRVKSSMEKTQKEYYLREQMKAIQKELGDKDGKSGEVSDLRKKIDESDMPERIREVALKELGRYEKVPQSSAESAVIRNYLEWLLALPWTEKSQD